jgi:hypothetical protein
MWGSLGQMPSYQFKKNLWSVLQIDEHYLSKNNSLFHNRFVLHLFDDCVFTFSKDWYSANTFSYQLEIVRYNHHELSEDKVLSFLYLREIAWSVLDWWTLTFTLKIDLYCSWIWTVTSFFQWSKSCIWSLCIQSKHESF